MIEEIYKPAFRDQRFAAGLLAGEFGRGFEPKNLRRMVKCFKTRVSTFERIHGARLKRDTMKYQRSLS